MGNESKERVMENGAQEEMKKCGKMFGKDSRKAYQNMQRALAGGLTQY